MNEKDIRSNIEEGIENSIPLDMFYVTVVLKFKKAGQLSFHGFSRF